MVSRENVVILVFIAAAVVLLYATTLLGEQPLWVGGAVVVGVGVIAPLLVNGYLDRQSE
ncbi:hypothetical protein GRX01_14670 [Halobaculum sp. WSA2]|uniref:Uncharacterized protein n=1 Tax=Halobaculum saliterrae TaxID=2073113 RepID=A0A6B0SVC1_9EURY|nr:hypothetical protein [Halobaculum saliterrae]MXR42575.1 hypothetical protein [Halobaculum saliterrae]